MGVSRHHQGRPQPDPTYGDYETRASCLQARHDIDQLAARLSPGRENQFGACPVWIYIEIDKAGKRLIYQLCRRRTQPAAHVDAAAVHGRNDGSLFGIPTVL